MKKQKVYISGPITSLPLEEARTIFAIAEMELAEAGYAPVNPMKNGLALECSWEEHMKEDIVLLLGCDFIYLLPGYSQSVGAMLELEIAKPLGIEIINLKQKPLYGIALAEKHLNDTIEEPSRTLKQKTIPYTTIQRRSDFLSNFENGWELYRTNNIFNRITELVMHGSSEYDVLLDLILYLDKNPLNESK